MLLVISNPVCGARTGHAFVTDHVVPRLAAASRPIDALITTDSAGHAGRAVVEYLETRPEEQLDVVLSSGDGTLHEVVNAVRDHGGNRQVRLVLVPSGTANALNTRTKRSCPRCFWTRGSSCC